MGRTLVVVLLALLGLLCAAGMGVAAYVVSRDSVAVPATRLQPKPLAPVAQPRRKAKAATTTTRTVPAPPAPVTTVDDHGGRGGGGGSSGRGGGGHGGDD